MINLRLPEKSQSTEHRRKFTLKRLQRYAKAREKLMRKFRLEMTPHFVWSIRCWKRFVRLGKSFQTKMGPMCSKIKRKRLGAVGKICHTFERHLRQQRGLVMQKPRTKSTVRKSSSKKIQNGQKLLVKSRRQAQMAQKPEGGLKLNKCKSTEKCEMLGKKKSMYYLAAKDVWKRKVAYKTDRIQWRDKTFDT